MLRYCCAMALAALAAEAVQAQPAALTRAAEPEQKTTPLGYESPFNDYRGFKLEPPEPWPILNDRVRDLDGHIGALKDAEPERTDDRRPDNLAPAGGRAGQRR